MKRTRNKNKFLYITSYEKRILQSCELCQTIKLRNILPDYVINVATLYELGMLIRKLQAKCGESEFCFHAANRVLNRFVLFVLTQKL